MNCRQPLSSFRSATADLNAGPHLQQERHGSGYRWRPITLTSRPFGEWGFTLATRQPWRAPDRYPPGLRFLTVETTAALFQFTPDMGPVETEINRLNNQILVHYYEREWNQVTQ